MSLFSKLLKQAAPVVATIAPFVPGGQAVAAVAGAKVAADRQAAINYQQALQAENIARQRNQNMEFFLPNKGGGFSDLGVRPLRQQAQPSFLSGVGSFLGDVTSNLVDPISKIFNSPVVRPFISQQSRGQPALPTQSTSGGQESAESGAQTASIGGLGNLVNMAGRFLRTPAGQVGTGLAIGGATSLMGSAPSGMRMTRKMKSQARTVLNMVGGDISAASQILGIDEGTLVSLLLRRFRNDGPVVTKAALRKTKQTVRRLKSMCDMYDSLRPTATRRRAPMKRASSTTLIKN